ncbi:FMN-dependent NADH-azoreductase [Pseudorhodoplanes sinuspersici]|uniref:FMN dependent NADH:quinone oxidoreductase n=1 Tax=Pseudorhodoplanes sinuspersici TaxID=1235591 RepID=A0A1W7A0T8_9HYPH|nr:FMN-dependent NADH-azoreductase [Pseudorhodoplanes sinuspersici]
MARLMNVQASPRRGLSMSAAATQTFVSALSRAQSALEVDVLDLWTASLPEFSGDTINAKYAKLAGRAMGPGEETAWGDIVRMIDRLKAADGVVIATPMWNFSIPYKLKHWIDLITQPGLTFSFDPAKGYAPLLPSKPVLVILSSAGDYANGPSRGRPDLATPYLREALKFIGLNEVSFVAIGPTVASPEDVATARADAEARLDVLATTFLKASR